MLITLVFLAFPGDRPEGTLQGPKIREAIPKIDLIYPPYGTIFDRTCSQFLKDSELKPEWIGEVGKLRSTLQQEWENEGPNYLSVVLGEIGLPFPYREMQAVLTICSVSTMSMPLMINVRPFLVAAKDHPPAGDFTEKVFHELMHYYVEPVHAKSGVRKKYAAESPVVVNHLHVMALEKFALLRLGKVDELKYLEHLYETDPAPSYYKRAWQIVNDVEGYEAFIKELKASASG
jgi:hypothetical protein